MLVVVTANRAVTLCASVSAFYQITRVLKRGLSTLILTKENRQ